MNWPPPLPILSVLVWAPATGAVVSAIPRENRTSLRRSLALGFALVALAAALSLALGSGAPPRELHAWLPAFGISYDLGLDGFGSVVAVWIAALTIVALVSVDSTALDQRTVALLLLAETSLLGLASAGDAALFLSFFASGATAFTLLLGRADVMKKFFFHQSAAVFLAVAFAAVSLHQGAIQTGFPSTEIARLSSLVSYPDWESRMFFLGAVALAFAAPLFPLTSWIAESVEALAPSGKVLLLGGWSLAGSLFFVRMVLPSVPRGAEASADVVLVLGALSTLYAAVPGRSWTSLLAGFQGLVVLGLLSPTAAGAVAGRAGILHLALALVALVLYGGEGRLLRVGLLALVFAPTWWIILREQWGRSPVLTALAGLGLALMLLRLVRQFPEPERRRSPLLLVPILGLWLVIVMAPERLAPAAEPGKIVLEEE